MGIANNIHWLICQKCVSACLVGIDLRAESTFQTEKALRDVADSDLYSGPLIFIEEDRSRYPWYTFNGVPKDILCMSLCFLLPGLHMHIHMHRPVRINIWQCLKNIGLVTGAGGLFATRLVIESGGLATNPPCDKHIEDYSTLRTGPRQEFVTGARDKGL